MTVTVATLGFPRIGPKRELKTALERYWSGKIDQNALQGVAADVRAKTWTRQVALGADHVPSNDFSFYDQVLDTSVLVGAMPALYGWTGGPVPLDTYFAMARGSDGVELAPCGHDHGAKTGVPAQEMTKWFDTNYHYLAPEVSRDQAFALSSTKPVDEFLEAKAQGIHTRPVLLGPLTFLKLAKTKDGGFSPLSLLSALLPVYAEVLKQLAAAGADWVQIDEPCLALDLTDFERGELRRSYGALTHAAPGLRLMLTSYFGGYGDNLTTVVNLPVDGVHLDLVRAPDELETALAASRESLVLSLGVIDGRNVWRADLSKLLDRLEPVVAQRGADRIVLAPSCSLLHTPIDLALETALDPEVRQWLAFAVQKIEELAVLAKALNHGRASVAAELETNAKAAQARRTSPKIHDAAVAARLAATTEAMAKRHAAFDRRRAQQLSLPAFPTTTIGSFPQTEEVRKARSAHGKGELTDAAYETFLREETERAIRWQEEAGLDVLVHGEFERNDMVQYFGEQLSGFVFTKHAWVQSYGSRCVRPPILFGDRCVVAVRPEPDRPSGERHADRAGDDPELVVRPRRRPARPGLPADRPGHPRRGRRPGSRGRQDHPDR